MRRAQAFMTPAEAHDTLHRLRRATARYDAQPEAERLAETIERAPWVDAVFAHSAREAMVAKGFEPGPDWSAAPLRIGETWLLLCDQETRDGMAARLRYTDDKAARPSWSADARVHADRALRELGAAICRSGRRFTTVPCPERFEVSVACPRDLRVRDDSLGTAVCAAALSSQLQRAPRQNVAATARVMSDGVLGSVECLDKKLEALAARWPGVDTVVVASDQVLPDSAPATIRIVRCHTVTEALSVFALDPSQLPPCHIEHQLSQVGGFKSENSVPHSIEAWRALSWKAFEAAVALQGRACHKGDSAIARAWAALFALHAGDNARSTDLLRPVMDGLDDLPAQPRMLAMIVRATGAIDGDPEHAIALAQEALDTIAPEREREPALYGQALGTLGRAYMHCGELASAEPRLRASVAFHESHPALEKEGPRSRTYLATCLRKAGRATEALEVLDCAFEAIDRLSEYNLSYTTRLYAELERGRCLLQLGEVSRALDAFDICCRGQRGASDYPRLGALRGRAIGLRMQGRVEEADAIVQDCLAVARKEGDKLLGRVAAVAAGETIASGLACAIEPRVLGEVWEASFHSPASRAAVDRVLSTWIY